MKGEEAKKVTDKRKGRDMAKKRSLCEGGAFRDITFQFPHSSQQESDCRAGTGSSPWKSLQWHFLKSERKTSSSEGSSGVCPKSPVASLKAPAWPESLIRDETK